MRKIRINLKTKSKQIILPILFTFLILTNVAKAEERGEAYVRVVSPIELFLIKIREFFKLQTIIPQNPTLGSTVRWEGGLTFSCVNLPDTCCSFGKTPTSCSDTWGVVCEWTEPNGVKHTLTATNWFTCDMSVLLGCSYYIPSNAQAGTWTLKVWLEAPLSTYPFCSYYVTTERFNVVSGTTTTTVKPTTTTTTSPPSQSCEMYGYYSCCSCPSGLYCEPVQIGNLLCCNCVVRQTTTTIQKSCGDYGYLGSCPSGTICVEVSPAPGLICCASCNPSGVTTTTIYSPTTTTYQQGECEDGKTQVEYCENLGRYIVTKVCVNKRWVETGQSCYEFGMENIMFGMENIIIVLAENIIIVLAVVILIVVLVVGVVYLKRRK